MTQQSEEALSIIQISASETIRGVPSTALLSKKTNQRLQWTDQDKKSFSRYLQKHQLGRNLRLDHVDWSFLLDLGILTNNDRVNVRLRDKVKNALVHHAKTVLDDIITYDKTVKPHKPVWPSWTDAWQQNDWTGQLGQQQESAATVSEESPPSSSSNVIEPVNVLADVEPDSSALPASPSAVESAQYHVEPADGAMTMPGHSPAPIDRHMSLNDNDNDNDDDDGDGDHDSEPLIETRGVGRSPPNTEHRTASPSTHQMEIRSEREIFHDQQRRIELLEAELAQLREPAECARKE